MSNWYFQEFSYVAIGNMDSRRAAFLLYDFINIFDIEDFKVIQSDGEWQKTRIEIVYKQPEGYVHDEIEDRWYKHLKNLTESKTDD